MDLPTYAPTYTTIDTLKAARAVLTSPENWTKGCYARDAAGDACKPYSPNAVKWCAIGACAAVSRQSVYSCKLEMVTDELIKCMPNKPDEPGQGDIADWQDAPETTHEQMLAMFDCAITNLNV